jgi:opacity protein-like surface antigen
MRLTLPRSALYPLFALPLLALPSLSAADGAFLFKAGSMRVTDSSQNFEGQVRALDEDSSGTLALNIEARKPSGVAFGAEFLTYRNDFTPPTGEPGEAKTWAIMFVGKKYFVSGGPFHPFFGAGIGGARVNYSFRDPFSGDISDDEFNLALQAVAGFEFRFDGIAFSLEAKHVYHDVESGGNEYDPTATGVFAGFGFTW